MLTKIPTKTDLPPCEKLISESQERMLIVCTPGNFEKIQEVFSRWNLEYSCVGKINESGTYSVYTTDNLLYSEKMNEFEVPEQHWQECNEDYWVV